MELGLASPAQVLQALEPESIRKVCGKRLRFLFLLQPSLAGWTRGWPSPKGTAIRRALPSGRPGRPILAAKAAAMHNK